MNNDLEKAKFVMKKEGCTCVLVKGDAIYKSTERGVKPLLQWLSQNTDFSGFSCADKAVGKAAAFLYVLANVKEVYAPIMSEGAVEVFLKYKIHYTYDLLVKSIINRTKTGMCPMELAVLNITEPKEALEAIKKRFDELQRAL